MKKLTSLFLSLILILSTVPAVFADGNSIFAGGTGTAADPYIISTAAQFAAFADSVNNGTNYSGQYIKLANDINLGETTKLQIGSICDECDNGITYAGSREYSPHKEFTDEKGTHPDSRYFSGVFDGNGYSITYNYTDGTGDQARYGSLFTVLYSLPVTDKEGSVPAVATVKNLTVKGSRESAKWLGGIVGFAQGATIENCVSEMNLKCSSWEYKGGIVAEACDSTIRRCVNKGKLNFDSSKQCNGGIVGHLSESYVEDCINYSDIIISNSVADWNDVYTGGIAGKVMGDRGSTIYRCINKGNICLDDNKTADSYDGSLRFIGGILGATDNSKVTILDCVNTGNIDRRGSADVGGIAGKTLANSEVKGSEIANCYNTGDGAMAAFVGYASTYTHIANCYSLGKHDADKVAVAGYDTYSFTNLYAVQEPVITEEDKAWGYDYCKVISADTITADDLNGETGTSWVEGNDIPELKTLAAARPGYLLADRKDGDALDVRLFALFANEHNYATGEGGIVTTNSLDLADQIAIVAVYDSEGKLIQAKRAGKIANETIFVNFEDVPGAASVSLFIWDDINVKNPVAFSNVLTTTLPVVSDEPAAE